MTVFFSLPETLPGNRTEIGKKSLLTLQLDAVALPGAGTGAITVMAKNITLATDLGDAKATKSYSMSGAVRVAAALRESTISDIAGGLNAIERPIARVETDYTSFSDDPFFADDPKMLVDSVGTLFVYVSTRITSMPDPTDAEETITTTTGLRNAADGSYVTGLADIVDIDESTVTYAGNFSFATKVYLAPSDSCGGGDVADDLLMRGADNVVTNMMSLTPVILSEATGDYLCIMVDGDTSIPETSRYRASVDYERPADTNTRVYAPTGKARRLAYIMRNGIRVTIPYLTTASQYNQRIVVANLSDGPVDYSISFHPEAGTEAEAGVDAMGTFGEGTTVLSVTRDDVVTITGDRTRTAAFLVIDADVLENISVATTQVNLQTGATDTVVYR